MILIAVEQGYVCACSYHHLSAGSNTPCSSQEVLWEDFLQGPWGAIVICCSHHNLASVAESAWDEVIVETKEGRGMTNQEGMKERQRKAKKMLLSEPFYEKE